jgi:ABC-2 type transport system permease protein
MLNLLRYELRARRWAVIGWGLGLAIFGFYIVALYPEFAPELANFDVGNIELYKILGDFADMASFRGFISAEMFSFVPILLAIYAVVNATGTLAGEEDNGLLELFMAMPIPRWQLVLTKIVALGLALLSILVATGLGFIVGYSRLDPSVGTGGISAADLMTGSLAMWPLTFMFATMSLFLAAYLPNRRIAAITASVIVVVSYFGNNLATFSEPLEAIQPIFPFYYFDGSAALTEGLDPGNTATLLGASLVFLALAFLSFQRRNVTVGAWPWQRARA